MSYGNPLDEVSLHWINLLDKIEHITFNKLFILYSTNESLQQALPSLLKAYQLALEHQLIEDDIDFINEKIILDPINSNMAEVIDSTFQLFHSVYSLRKELAQCKQCGNNCASVLIEAVLDVYPFNPGAREKVYFNTTNDFNFSFSPLFLNAVLQELLYFAFGNARTPPKKVDIYFSTSHPTNTIHFRLMSAGIGKDNVEALFSNSLTVRGQTITPGLNLSHLALRHVSGDLIYQLEANKYLDVIILIPQA